MFEDADEWLEDTLHARPPGWRVRSHKRARREGPEETEVVMEHETLYYEQEYRSVRE